MKTAKWILFPLFLLVVLFGIISILNQLSGLNLGFSKNVQSSPRDLLNTDPKVYGVNISGGEFGEEQLPGVMNNDYIYPQIAEEYQYFSEKGVKVIRLPIRWERVQHSAFEPLHGPDIDQIKDVLKVASKYDMKVIIDLHNFGRYYGHALSIQEANQLADVWTKLAYTLRDEPGLYGYELMNEPHDLPGGSKAWAGIAQFVVTEIRKVDQKTLILIPGYEWQSARNWSKINPYFPLSGLDSNIAYSAHIYFDSNGSGRYEKSFDEDKRNTQIGVTRSKDFREWLKKHNVKGMFTEYGVPHNDSRWLTAMDLFLESVEQEPNILGTVYWSAGPWWKNYPLSIEPRNGMDRVQMQTLKKYIDQNP